ncbi:MAG: hypothetical protein HXY22_07940 [Alphaproteobacteria bacterium]|nr:hypothetical protein [Alphaproteobacteria bacterium]
MTLDEAIARLVPGRPLIISDADEVLLHFIEALETYLLSRGYFLDLVSFAITGNVIEQATGERAPAATVKTLLRDFFLAVDSIRPVEGAADALRELEVGAQILVLSNVPAAAIANRARNLKAAGITAPLIQNDGLKGDAIARIARKAGGPVVFIDDLPNHHNSAATAFPDVHRLQFVANPRLRGLVGKAPDAHARIDEWPLALPWIRARLQGKA